MNLKKQFLLISLIQLTWACDSGNSIHYQPALLQLEDSLEQTPQKTLHALWLMDTTAFRPEDRQLYHYIAYKGAMLLPDEKNPKPEELKASIGYFREKGDSARLYQLYYYLGQVYTGHFAWLRASNSFAEARKYAGQNPRRVFQAKLGEAYVYRFKMMYKEEETCLEQALQIARSLSDRNLIRTVGSLSASEEVCRCEPCTLAGGQPSGRGAAGVVPCLVLPRVGTEFSPDGAARFGAGLPGRSPVSGQQSGATSGVQRA